MPEAKHLSVANLGGLDSGLDFINRILVRLNRITLPMVVTLKTARL